MADNTYNGDPQLAPETEVDDGQSILKIRSDSLESRRRLRLIGKERWKRKGGDKARTLRIDQGR